MFPLGDAQWSFRTMRKNLKIFLQIIGITFSSIPVTFADEPIIMEWEDHKGYELLTFDTAHGIFDPQMDSLQRIEYMKLWKKARKINLRLNPDRKHGGLSESYKYLKSEKIFKSPYLSKYTIFLVSPGVRPCDYDENCKEVKDVDDAADINTQFMIYFPVVIDSNGQPFKEYGFPDFFIDLINSQGNKIKNKVQAKELTQVFVFLTNRFSRQTDDFKTNFCIKEGREYKEEKGVYSITMKLQGSSYITFHEVEIVDFEVDKSGNIQEVKRYEIQKK